MPGINQRKNYTDLNKRLDKYCIAVNSLFTRCNEQAARIALSTGYSVESGVPFLFSDFPLTKARIDKAMGSYARDMEQLITSGMRKEWNRSNDIQDRFADSNIKYYYNKKDGVRSREYYKRNENALDAFMKRKDGGMNLSEKIWNISQNYKTGIEKTISVALERGTDAKTLAKQLTKYLKNTKEVTREYKRLYGVEGKVDNIDYRAMRLARSEINMAYRIAERDRWNQYDFVIGYEIRTNGGAGCKGICEELAGAYPRDYFWMGWHPSCRCYEMPILKSLAGHILGESENINELPENYSEWIEENKDKILNSKSIPYHVRDNYEQLGNNEILKRCRYEEYLQMDADPSYIDVHFNPENGGLMGTHVEHNSSGPNEQILIDGHTGKQLEHFCQREIYNNGGKCILRKEGEIGQDGNALTSLDADINGKIMDINSIWTQKEHYRNNIKGKSVQAKKWNELKDVEGESNSLCLYFHDPSMYSAEKVFLGLEKALSISEDVRIFRHILCVVRGEGMFWFNF